MDNTEVRFLVESYYDVQRLRIDTASQLRSYENSDTLRSVVFDQLHGIEKQVKRELEKYVKDQPVWTEWLKGVSGIGPVIACGLLAWLDVTRFDNPGKLLAYSGQHVVKGEAPRRKRGQKMNWNPRAKTLAWKIGESFVKSGKGYRNEYDNAKKIYEARNDKLAKDKQISKLHIHNRAKRKAVRLFLCHYWHVGRELQDLPTMTPYAIEKLGHTTYIPPYEK